MTAVDPRRALSFGAFAEDYERWRPGYPREAVDWLVPPGATRVADVGAHTVVARVCVATSRPTAPVRHRAFCVRWRPS